MEYTPEYVAQARANLTGAPCLYCGQPATRIALDIYAEGVDTPLCDNPHCYVTESRTSARSWSHPGVVRW